MNRLFQFVRDKIVHINDSPQKIAIGFGIGVALGILPGTGPLAALGLAFLLRVNRAAAFAGGLLTNTWLSIVTFVFAVKIGSFILGVEWQGLYDQAITLVKPFHFKNFFSAAVIKIFYPIFLGYVILGALAGVLAYFLVLFVIYEKKKHFSKNNKIEG